MEETRKDDEALRRLFGEFDPELGSSSRSFMAELQRRMEGVEIVREHTVSIRRRSRWACVVSALAGFLTGVVLTLLYPLVSGWIDLLATSADGSTVWIATGVGLNDWQLPDINMTMMAQVLTLLLMVAVVVLVSMSTYNAMAGRALLWQRR